MWPFQSIQSFWTVARWRSSGAPRSRSIMGYGGNFMRADRSEAVAPAASFANPSALRAPPPSDGGGGGGTGDSHGQEAENTGVGRRRGAWHPRGRQPPFFPAG